MQLLFSSNLFNLNNSNMLQQKLPGRKDQGQRLSEDWMLS